jgi:hypothetical protein
MSPPVAGGDVRARSGQLDEGDIPLGAVITDLLKWSWLALLCALLLAGSVAMIVSVDRKPPTSTVLLGLTEEVEWPRYEVVRERVLSRLHPELIGEVKQTLLPGDSLGDVDGALLMDEGSILITVRASSDRAAVDSARQLAARLVADEREALTASDASELQAHQADLERLQAELALDEQALQEALLLEAAANDTVGALPEGQRAEALVAAQQARLARELVEVRVKEAVSRRAVLQATISQLSRRLEGGVSTVEIVRQPRLEDASTAGRGAPILLAGITGLVLGVLIARLAISRRGRIRRADVVAALTGGPVVALDSGQASWERGAAAVADLATSEVVGVLGPGSTSNRVVRKLAATFNGAGFVAEVMPVEWQTSTLNGTAKRTMVGLIWPDGALQDGTGLLRLRACYEHVVRTARQSAHVVLVELGAPSPEMLDVRGQTFAKVVLVVVSGETRYDDIRGVRRLLRDEGLELGLVLFLEEMPQDYRDLAPPRRHGAPTLRLAARSQIS